MNVVVVAEIDVVIMQGILSTKELMAMNGVKL
jgi:hypothetical protein